MSKVYPKTGSWEWHLNEYETRKRNVFDRIMISAIHRCAGKQESLDELKAIRESGNSNIEMIAAIDTLFDTTFYRGVWEKTLNEVKVGPFST